MAEQSVKIEVRRGYRVTLCSAALAGGVALAGLTWWFSRGPLAVAERVPDADNAARQSAAQQVDIEGTLETLAVLPARPVPYPGSWRQFRGVGGENVAREDLALAEVWPAGGPPQCWSLSLGAGYAGAAIHHGRVYVLDYDEERQADTLRCVSLAQGTELWRRAYRIKIKPQHGISRTVPAVTDQVVVSLGPKCHVLCADAVSGEYRWSIDLVERYGTTVPQWYAGQCPLIDDTTVILAPAARALMIGVDCATGEVRWELPNPEGWSMSHSSVMKMTLAGREMYVYFASGGAVGVGLDGTLLWSSTAWPHRIIAPSPVALDGDRVLITSGYGRGSLSLRIRREGDHFAAVVEQAWSKREFACEQQTPVRYGDVLFTVMPPDGGGQLRNRLLCMGVDGVQRWVSDDLERPGLGPFMVVNDRLLTLSDDGVLTMSRAGGERYARIAQARVLEGHEAWAPMAFADGRLLVRDLHRMVCLDLREGAGR